MRESGFVGKLIYISKKQPLKAVEDSGVTWIIPADDKLVLGSISLSTKESIKAISDQLEERFKNLGVLLEESITLENYIPRFLQRAIFDEFLNNALTMPNWYECESLKDNFCPFFTPNNKDKIISAIMDFFQEYGLPDMNSDKEYMRILEYISIDDLSVDQRYAGVPVTYLAYLVYEIYYFNSYPELYTKALKKSYSELSERSAKKQALHTARRLFDEDGKIKIEAGIVYNFTLENGVKRVEAHLDSIFDLIKFCLYYYNPNYKQICIYCGEDYDPKRPNQIYCTPACRNRANSNNSYKKKKKKL